MTDTDITIPPAALEAAAKELCEATFKVSEYGPWESTPQWMQDMWRSRARAACIAMLKAWPGAHEAKSPRLNSQIIILPLPQETSDA